MNGSSTSKRAASSGAAQKPDKKPDKKTLAQELALAEQRGAERARAQLAADLREMLDEHRRVVRLGDHQIEVVEVAAVERLLGPGG